MKKFLPKSFSNLVTVLCLSIGKLHENLVERKFFVEGVAKMQSGTLYLEIA